MADFITPFDPTAMATGIFPVQLANGGWLFIHNLSPVELSFQVGNMGTPVLVPANVARCFPVPRDTNNVKWKNLGTVSAPGQAQTFLVYGEAYTPDEWRGGEMYIALARQVNVGNTVSTSVGQSIINDGNAGGTSIVEATQTGASGSNVAQDNSGNLTLREWSGSVLTQLFRVIANAASGTDNVVLSKVGNFFTHILGNFKVDGTTSLDAAAITTTGDGRMTVAGPTNTSTLFTGTLPSLPASGATGVFKMQVVADAVARVALQIRSDGFGQIGVGDGTNPQKHLFLQSDGIHADAEMLLGSFQGTWHTPAATDRGFSIKDAAPQLELDAVAPAATARDIVLAGIDASAMLHAGIRAESNGVGHIGTDDAGTKRLIAAYEGTTDPAGRAGITVNEGDVWLNG